MRTPRVSNEKSFSVVDSVVALGYYGVSCTVSIVQKEAGLPVCDAR